MISSDVVIITRRELDDIKARAFERGVERGRFEQRWDDSKANKNTPSEGPSKTKLLPEAPASGGGPITSN